MKAPPRENLEVTIVGGHHSVLSTAPFAAGETLLVFVGVESAEPGRHSVQIGKGRHLHASNGSELDWDGRSSVWRFLNHSCAPNTVVRGRLLVAIEDIAAGTEVTFDYNTTEWDMASPFECSCGEAACLGLVRGYRWLKEAERASRREITAEYLLDNHVLVGNGDPMPLLFPYGTLQQGAVQLSTFGRLLHGRPDALVGFERSTIVIEDEDFAATSGSARHAIVRRTEKPDSRVEGTVFDVSEGELASADDYEPAGYERISVTLESGKEAWVYAAADS